MALDELDLEVEVHLSSANWDEYQVLRPFFASFSARDASDGESGVGGMTGWIVWSMGHEDLARAADSLSADSAYIGGIAQRIVDELRKEDPFLEQALLLDRLWIDRPWRGKGLLRPMLDRLVDLLRLDVNGCVIVTEPEPQREGGGPYPDGTLRDTAMNGLVRSLEAAGLECYGQERAMWKLAARD